MQELNDLAARVWKRVAAGEAYVQPPPQRPVQRQYRQQNCLPLLTALLVLKLIIDN